jgi:hypothetical protein
VRSFLEFNGKLYAGTNSHGIYTSTDGTTFTQNTSFPTSYSAYALFEYNGKLYVGTYVGVSLLEVKAFVIPFENVTTILDCKLLSGKRLTQSVSAYSNDSNLEVTVSNEAITEDGYDTAIIEYTKE